MTEQGCRAWGRPARTGWRCPREGWRPVWAGLADAGTVLGRRRLCTGLALPSFGAGADGMGGPGCRGDRTGAGTPGDRTDSAPPGPEESRQGRTARVAAWGLRHSGPGVRQSVIRTLEGGGGGRGRGAGGGPEESNYVTPQQGLPHTDIAPPLTHPPARPALSPSLAPCPDGPHSPHRPDPAPNVSAPSHEAHRPHRRPQTKPSSPRPTHTDRLCQQATAASRLPTDQATNHARPNPRQEATARSPVRRRHASPYGTGTPTPTTSRSPRHRPRPRPGQPSRHPPQPHQARLNGSPEQPWSGPPTEPSPGRNLRGSVHDGDGERAPGAQ